MNGLRKRNPVRIWGPKFIDFECAAMRPQNMRPRVEIVTLYEIESLVAQMQVVLAGHDMIGVVVVDVQHVRGFRRVERFDDTANFPYA